MSSLRTPSADAGRLLRLAGEDPGAARKAFSTLPLDAQVALVCEAPVARRADLLALAERPEALIPALPPAELCFTAKAVGLADAGWVLEHATEEQIAACVDLDAWRGLGPDRERFTEWLQAFEDAGEEALLRAARAVDFEVLVLQLRARAAVHLKPNDDEGWEAPPGAQTLDGQFYLLALRDDDELTDLLTLLRLLFEQDYWFYFRLVQAGVWELESETEEWALRWRAGRLQDLGFPSWEEAMQVYGHLRPERCRELPAQPPGPSLGEWPLPIWMPDLPAAYEGGPSLFRALASLDAEERRPCLFAFLAVANRVAVAERLPLGEADTLPRAIDKVARLASLGLDFLVEEHGVEPAQVLRRAGLERLFRVGVNLEGDAALPAAPRAEPPEPPEPAEGDR